MILSLIEMDVLKSCKDDENKNSIVDPVEYLCSCGASTIAPQGLRNNEN